MSLNTPHITSMPPLTNDNSNKTLCIVAGEGELPLIAVSSALAQGYKSVFVYVLEAKTAHQMQKLLPKSHIRRIIPGLLQKIYDQAKQDSITDCFFVGKVNKWILLRNPQLDKRALALMNQLRTRSDDGVMLKIIADAESEGIRFIPQSDFLRPLFTPTGIYSRRHPTTGEYQDITLAMSTARELARLDIGQTAIVSHGMVIALEAIEGTDRAILRAKEWVRGQGGVVAKVEKPNQDNRFDIPTVGPRTLKALKKAGLHILAIEAGKTMVIDQPKLIALADKWQMIFIAV